MPKQAESISCFHCGLPATQRYAIAGLMDQSEVWYCCLGCKAVAETIEQSGYAQYYQLRDGRADRPAEPIAEIGRYAGFDQAEVLEDISSEIEGDLREIFLSIEGIHCAACVWLLERQIGRLAGVKEATLNLSNHRARVSWDSSLIKLSAIFEAIQNIGYTGHPFQPAAEQALLKKEEKQATLRLGIAAIGMAQVMMYAIPLYFGAEQENTGQEMAQQYRDILRWASLLITTPVVFISARPFFNSAWRDIKQLRPGMDVPVSIAIGGAYLASVWATITLQGEVYYDSVSMFTFLLLLSRYIEMKARHASGQSEHSLHRILPDFAQKLVDGEVIETPIKALKPGDRVLIKSGEMVPVDGKIELGISQLNEATMTGEFYPIKKIPGDTVLAGTGNIENPIEIVVTKTIADSQLNLIERLLEGVQHQKPQIAQLADQIAGYFVSGVLFLAVLVYAYWRIQQPESAFWITLSVLVVTCPCALSLATPTAITAAVHALRKQGFLITGKQTLSGLASATELVFDKTGTLTVGELVIASVNTGNHYSESEAIAIACALEQQSEHPIATAFKKLSVDTADLTVTNLRQPSGLGIEAHVSGVQYRIGRQSYVQKLIKLKVDNLAPSLEGMGVYLACEEGYIASFELNDQVREHAKRVVNQLNSDDLNTCLLSGDSSSAPMQIADQLGIKQVYSSQLPEQKVQVVADKQLQGERVIMVGDGVNDAPVLASANVSIAMGSGTDLAKTHADAVLLSNDLSVIPMAIAHAKKTQRIIRQNISWALLYNLMALPLAASGSLEPYMAAVGMSLSSLFVVGNAYRLTRIPQPI